MAKFLIGLGTAVVIALGGYFGFQFYVQQRITGEIDAAFDQVRSNGGKASHGKISFDLLKHTVTIADIEGESGSQQPVHIKIAGITATGVGQPDATHFSADSIEATNITLEAAISVQPSWRIAYKMPRLSVKDYSGPASLKQHPSSSSVIDLYRFALEQFADISASSVSLPSIAGNIDIKVPTQFAGDFKYSDIAIEGIKAGNIAAMKLSGVSFSLDMQQTVGPQAGKPQKVAGNLEKLAAYDIDTTVLAAVLDPQKANDDRYHRVYRQISAGSYDISPAQGQHMRIDGMEIDDVALRPSRLQIPAIVAMIQNQKGGKPTPAQAQDMIDKIAGLYEGLRIAKGEFRGVVVDAPQGPIKLATMSYNLENGKGDWAIDGLDAVTPMGPFRVGRFALQSFDIANLLRISAQFSNPAQPPPPQQMLGLLAAIGGIEVKGVVAPFKDGKRTVTVDAINLNWGQFVGSIPTKAHLDVKGTSPVDTTSPTQQALVIAGIDTLAVGADLSAAWNESSGTFVLDVPTLEVGSLLKASFRGSLAQVTRDAFSLDPQKTAVAASQIEAGTLELTLHDLGAVDLLIAQYARMKNLSREEARSAIADEIRAGGEKATQANPQAPELIEALIRFVQTPHQTLLVKLTPLGKVHALHLVELLQIEPTLPLAQLRIQASTGL